MYCDGTCMRAFHAGVNDDPDTDTREHSADNCNPFSCPEDLFTLLDEHTDESFQCPNCLASEHQCFVCKEEGPSQSGAMGRAPRVYRCDHRLSSRLHSYVSAAVSHTSCKL